MAARKSRRGGIRPRQPPIVGLLNKALERLVVAQELDWDDWVIDRVTDTQAGDRLVQLRGHFTASGQRTTLVRAEGRELRQVTIRGAIAPLTGSSANVDFLMALIGAVQDALVEAPHAFTVAPLRPRELAERQALVEGRARYWAGSPALDVLGRKR